MAEIHINAPEGRNEERNSCGSCAAASIEAGGHVVCRRNPPGRSPTGIAIWPPIDPEKDWCMQWSKGVTP